MVRCGLCGLVRPVRGCQVIGAGACGTWRAAQWLIDFVCTAQGARSQQRRADAGGESAASLHVERANGENVVTIQQIPELITQHHPIRVPVIRDADIGAVFLDKSAHQLGMQASTSFVDILSVRLISRLNELRPELREYHRRDLVRGAVRRIENDLQTNGILLDEEWASFLKQHDFLVGLSIDGPASFHNKHRYSKGGKPTHERVMEAAALLHKFEVPFVALCVVNADNSKRPIDVYRFLRDEVRPRMIQFIPGMVSSKVAKTRSSAP